MHNRIQRADGQFRLRFIPAGKFRQHSTQVMDVIGHVMIQISVMVDDATQDHAFVERLRGVRDVFRGQAVPQAINALSKEPLTRLDQRG